MRPPPVTIIGHRGAGADGIPATGTPLPENSLASFARAFALGADEVETDLALSRDGQILLLHDPLISVAGGPRPVAGLDFAEIRSAKPETARLADALGEFPGRFVLELKRHTDVAAILESLRGPAFAPHLVRLRFVSFELEALLSARRLFPGIPCAWIATTREGRFDPWMREKHVRRCLDGGIGEICGHWRLLLGATAKRAVDSGLELGLGPINTPAAVDRCLRIGARRLYTDRIETVRARLRELE